MNPLSHKISAIVLCTFLWVFQCDVSLNAASSKEGKSGKGAKVLVDPNARDFYVARHSGNWDSDIWCLMPANTYDAKLTEPQRGLRPVPDCNVEVNGPNVTLTLTGAVTLNKFRIVRDKGKLVIDKGGLMTLDREYFGQGGINTSGSVEVKSGGAMVVNGMFYLAGILLDCTGTGSFYQNGGDVTVNGTVFLTGPLTTSSSAQATGIYNLNAGALTIRPKDAKQPGLRNGIGRGTFNFAGGTLDSASVDLDIANAQKGNLSPGGDKAVGACALLSDEARTYTQGKDACFTVNVAGAKKFDALLWTNRSKNATVVLESGTTLRILPLDNYRPVRGATFDVIKADRLEVGGPLRLEGPDAAQFTYEVVQGTPAVLRLKY